MNIFNFLGHLLTELVRKTENWRQKNKQTSSSFYTSNNACLQNNMLKTLRRNNKDVSLYFHISASAYEIAV